MALQLKVELDSGVVLDHAYCRIGSLSGNKNKITIMLDTFMNQETCLTGRSIVQQVGFEFKPSVEDNAPNFIKQGYEYLKTLQGFLGAVDVLE
ncbi:hypothetical protein [Paenibacillus sp. FSL L8-0494]|uniref:hypothetical protein n=1 Tax=Paenibacillus sp. FSL L8-0494 TaxID=2975352 RepID=UPI0030F9C6EA